MTPADSSVSFVAIADAHTQAGNLKYLPRIIDQVLALPQPPDFVVSLGDNIYGRVEQDTPADLRLYHREIQRLPCPHFHVLGNHEAEPVEFFGQLNWPELLGLWEMPGRWYSFDCRDVHCIVLDTWVGLAQPEHAATLTAQLDWLREDLALSQAPVLVFSHGALGIVQSDLEEWVVDGNSWFWPDPRVFEPILEQHADRIIGVFEGHKHKCLWVQRRGVTYHLVAPAYQHGGQFAQVFVGATREWRVQAWPERGEAEDHSRQFTYAGRS